MRILLLLISFAFAIPCLARHAIDDIVFDSTQTLAGCKPSSEESFTSVQAASFYHQHEFEHPLGVKPRQRQLRSFLCKNGGTTIYYYEYDDQPAAQYALEFVSRFVWDSINVPSEDHPEAIIAADNLIAVISGANIPAMEEALLAHAKAVGIQAVSIGKQLSTGRHYLEKKDFTNAVASFLPIAQLNHEPAQSHLCDIFLEQANASDAVLWCTRAAESGSPEAQVRLANMYLSNQWLQPDLVAAIHWLEKAGASGNSSAQVFLERYYRYKAEDVSDELLQQLEDYLSCKAAKDKTVAFACETLATFRTGTAIDRKSIAGVRLVGVAVEFNTTGNRPPALELAGLELHPNDAVSEKLLRFHAAATEPGEEEAIQQAAHALLAGKIPNDNFAYQFVATSPVDMQASIAWNDVSSKSTASVVDGYRILLRAHKNTIVALELHPTDQEVLKNPFFVMRYRTR